MTQGLKTFAIWAALAVVACGFLTLAETGGGDGGSLFGESPARLVLIAALAVVIVVLALVWIGRRVQAQQAQQLGGFSSMKAHKARLLQPGAETTRFADVGGLAEAKATLTDVVDWLKAPERWEKARVRPPRGVLLEGPPGTGKTLLARAVAGEAGVKFFVANATEFVEMFVGVGPARMRDLFEAASKEAPCVVFIDELDAIGRRRGSGVGHANEEREHALNELLVQMDGFQKQGRFVVVAASNRADVLDTALLRPGRFDVRLRVGDLGEAERLEVLRVHARGRGFAPDADLPELARRLDGATGALLEAVINEGAMLAMRRGRAGGDPAITRADLDSIVARSTAVDRTFGTLDQLLVESASQLAEPPTACFAELELVGGERLAGRVAWANAELLKIVPADGPARLVNRREVRQLVAVEEPPR